jgi:hypothetical protein
LQDFGGIARGIAKPVENIMHKNQIHGRSLRFRPWAPIAFAIVFIESFSDLFSESGADAESCAPVAIAVIGGLISSTL